MRKTWITLKNAVEAVVVDLRYLRNTQPTVKMIPPIWINTLEVFVSVEPDSEIGRDALIILVRDTISLLEDCADYEDDAEHSEQADYIRCAVRTLRPALYGYDD